MRIKTIFSVTCLSLLLLSPIPARGESLNQQLRTYKSQVDQLNGKLSGIKQQESAATNQAMALQQSLDALNASVKSYEATIAANQADIQKLQQQQTQLENERRQHALELGNLMRSNYESGVSNYLAVLLKATSLSDFLGRWEDLQAIVRTYSGLQTKIRTLNDNIIQEQGQIKQKVSTLQTDLNAKQQTQASRQTVLNQQKGVLAKLSASEKATVAAKLTAQAHVDSVQKLIQEQELEAALAEAGKKAGVNPQDSGSKNVVSTPVKMSAGAQKLLSYAEEFLGTPYVWGGTSPSPGFDCSGFVQHVFAHFGVSLYRTSESQYTEGKAVAASDLQPGDLVFYSTYASGASHVGIYVGNNTMIDSAAYGVAYDNMSNSYWKSRYLGARRVISE